MSDDKDLMWEEISTEHIVQDEWIDFRKSSFRFPDGNVFEPYYTYSRYVLNNFDRESEKLRLNSLLVV